MITHDDVYEIGTLGKPHGVKGELTFRFSDDIFDRTDADHLFIEVDGLLVPFFIDEYRFRSDTMALLKLDGIDSADSAQELNGCHVFFERALADDDDTISWAEIIGYRIVDAGSGNTVGNITAVDDTTINLIFEVQTPDGGSVLLPAAEPLIQDVDREGRSINLVIPDGLLNQNQ